MSEVIEREDHLLAIASMLRFNILNNYFDRSYIDLRSGKVYPEAFKGYQFIVKHKTIRNWIKENNLDSDIDEHDEKIIIHIYDVLEQLKQVLKTIGDI